MSTNNYDYHDFRRVRVEHALSVDITRSDVYSVSVTGDDPGHIRIEKQGDTLKIGRRGLDLLAIFRDRPHVEVAMPELDEIVLTGASHGKAQGFKSDRDLTIKVNGASHFEIRDVQCGRLKVDISGASNLAGDSTACGDTEFVVSGASRVELAGTGTNARVELSGASQARLSNLSLNDAEAEISGASNAQLKANGRLSINLSGASKLEYAGNPSLGDVKVTGASTLSRR
jgi:hypothetical protein